ncbi:LANO_0F04148g1_1 [Lachancea nothofagi CBS 11611]|uniref:LANO_0F04148g1_1 n=1 Tax=Lachancea nothofagi CBS 11611 TaxID=1266666 RepID=A0A1G4K7H1_9SACH|nr:LANO_0F04148g1_1 [Lachancea nothofagi CBS 11611]
MHNTSTQPDVAQVSQAVDALAKSILAQRVQAHRDKPERLRKLESLKQQFDALLQAQSEVTKSTDASLRLDAMQLDLELQKGLETVERQGVQYVLLPLVPGTGVVPTSASLPAPAPATPSKTSKKKKKNKVLCSYCQMQGHTRAHCEKRLLSPQP